MREPETAVVLFQIRDELHLIAETLKELTEAIKESDSRGSLHDPGGDQGSLRGDRNHDPENDPDRGDPGSPEGNPPVEFQRQDDQGVPESLLGAPVCEICEKPLGHTGFDADQLAFLIKQTSKQFGRERCEVCAGYT